MCKLCTVEKDLALIKPFISICFFELLKAESHMLDDIER